MATVIVNVKSRSEALNQSADLCAMLGNAGILITKRYWRGSSVCVQTSHTSIMYWVERESDNYLKGMHCDVAYNFDAETASRLTRGRSNGPTLPLFDYICKIEEEHKIDGTNYPEKLLRWLANMFPFTEDPKDEADGIFNCIHTYSLAGAYRIEELEKEIERLKQYEEHYNNMRPIFVEELIDTIEQEFKDGHGMSCRYVTKEGKNIETDVGYVHEWWEEYRNILRKRCVKGFERETAEK